MRVVSLLPSATELVCLVGGTDMLVGRSHECDYPPGIKDRPILTGAKNPFVSVEQMNAAVTATLSTGEGLYYINHELLKRLRPDVIVTQSLCNVCSVDLRLVEEVVKEMAAAPDTPGAEPPVVPQIISLNPFSIEDVLNDALTVGAALGLQEQAAAAVAGLQRRMDAAKALVAQMPPLQHNKVAFLEWFEPIFPGGHWTPQLIEAAGAQHPLNPTRGDGKGAGPSMAVYNDQLVSLDPDWIIICPCGLDLQETIKELPPLLASGFWPHLKAVREGRVVLVDGNAYFNRPGYRLVDCFEFLVGLLHDRPCVIPAGFAFRFLGREELAGEVAAWLDTHPGWQTRVQQGPPKDDNGQAAAAKSSCCGPQGCVPAAEAAPAGASD